MNGIDAGMPDTRTEILQPTSPEELPDDVGLLKEMLWNVLQSHDELAQQVAFLKRALWGKKSEKMVSVEQLELFEEVKRRLGLVEVEENEEDGKAIEPPQRMPKGKARTRRGGKREKTRGRFFGGTVPKDLRVETQHVHIDGATCPECGDPLEVLGADTRNRVAFKCEFYVQQTVVQTGFCKKHPRKSLFTPEGPDFIVPGGVLANELACKVVVDKYADNIPLNRQSKRFERDGIKLGSSTLSRNVLAFATLATHLVDAMQKELIASPWLQGDATGLPILVGDLGQAHGGQLWVYSNGETAVFQASMTKHGAFPKAFLKGFSGTWLADGASNYNSVASLPGVERSGCWSHARRYVFEARDDHVAAYEGLRLIRDLFLSERGCILMDLEERLAHRRRHAAPLLEQIRAWVDRHRRDEHVTKRPKSAFAKAVNYLHRQWKELVLFVERPQIPIHNNRSELLLRTPVIGRRNWLFAGSPKGADASAALFSIVATCMLQGIDPYAYLIDVMPSLGRKKPSEVRELTPSRWAARRRQEAA